MKDSKKDTDTNNIADLKTEVRKLGSLTNGSSEAQRLGSSACNILNSVYTVVLNLFQNLFTIKTLKHADAVQGDGRNVYAVMLNLFQHLFGFITPRVRTMLCPLMLTASPSRASHTSALALLNKCCRTKFCFVRVGFAFFRLWVSRLCSAVSPHSLDYPTAAINCSTKSHRFGNPLAKSTIFG